MPLPMLPPSRSADSESIRAVLWLVLGVSILVLSIGGSFVVLNPQAGRQQAFATVAFLLQIGATSLGLVCTKTALHVLRRRRD